MAAFDEDPMAWGGDAGDPSHIDGTPARPRTTDQQGGEPVTAADDAEVPVGSSVLLIAYGIFAGVYLLYVLGWVISIGRDTFSAGNVFFEVMYQFGEFLAIAAPVLWFGLTLLLTRGRRPLVRVIWLVAGILLLAPWPFIVGGAA